MTHTGENPYKCGHGDKVFSKNGAFKINLRAYTGEEPYQCKHCDKAFLRKGALKSISGLIHGRNHINVTNAKTLFCRTVILGVT